jgi:hypothetical protein
MGFFQHLEELRRRLTYSILAILVGFGGWRWRRSSSILARPLWTCCRRADLAYTALTGPP